MESVFAQVASVLAAIHRAFSDPWALIQAAVVAGCIAVAFLINRWLEPWLEVRVRRIHNWPRMLRLLAVVLRRTRWIVAALLLWVAATALHELTWSNRSRLVAVAAVLVTAWVLITIITRVIRNRTLANLIAFSGWLIVALAVLGLLGTAARLLETYALEVGAFRLSVLAALKGLTLFAVLLWFTGVVGDFIERWLRQSADITPSFQVLFAKLAKVALFAAVVLVSLSAVGIDLTALTVLSGAVGLGLGFGLQKVVSNLVSGMIILADRSIKPGDVIQLGETFGWIRSLRARFVSVVTRDGREYLIPNEDLITQQVINWSFTDQLVRLDVKFGVSYESDPHLVRRLAVEAAQSVSRVVNDPAPVCHLTAFGESSLDFILRFWISDPAGGLTNVRGAVLLACWDTFKENGVSIPYPQRVVTLRSPRTPTR